MNSRPTPDPEQLDAAIALADRHRAIMARTLARWDAEARLVEIRGAACGRRGGSGFVKPRRDLGHTEARSRSRAFCWNGRLRGVPGSSAVVRREVGHGRCTFNCGRTFRPPVDSRTAARGRCVLKAGSRSAPARCGEEATSLALAVRRRASQGRRQDHVVSRKHLSAGLRLKEQHPRRRLRLYPRWAIECRGR
jgi:hypothetical protein